MFSSFSFYLHVNAVAVWCSKDSWNVKLLVWRSGSLPHTCLWHCDVSPSCLGSVTVIHLPIEGREVDPSSCCRPRSPWKHPSHLPSQTLSLPCLDNGFGCVSLSVRVWELDGKCFKYQCFSLPNSHMNTHRVSEWVSACVCVFVCITPNKSFKLVINVLILLALAASKRPY